MGIQEARLNLNTVMVIDLFGNTSVRFLQLDDILSLAVKMEGVGAGTFWGRQFSHPMTF